jgi:hypothetical protein
MSKKALVPTNVYASDVQPTGRYVGDVYLDTSTTTLYTFNGSSWASPISQTVLDVDGGSPASTYQTDLDGGTP